MYCGAFTVKSDIMEERKNMKYKAVDEIEKFRYDDCQISAFRVDADCITLELEALIVKSDNSQNTNFTESYAGTVTARFIGGKITGGVKDGFKLYDANERLIKEVADERLSDDELKGFPKLCEGAYLYGIDKEDAAAKEDGRQQYALSIEFANEEENVMGDSYRLDIEFEKAVFEWERYMNRVQN
jgi:hypothetical protein